MPELQDVFRIYGEQYVKEHYLPPYICKVIRAIENCRTAKLGGHKDTCNECGFMKMSYNSCRAGRKQPPKVPPNP